MQASLQRYCSRSCSASRSSCRGSAVVHVVSEPRHEVQVTCRRALLSGIALGFASLRPRSSDAAETEFRASDFIAEEGQQLERMMHENKSLALRTLDNERLSIANETLRAEIQASSDGQLCATPFGVDLVGITQTVALIGALVGGVVARQRKEEVGRLNEQLRQINLQLKKKLKHAPVGSLPGDPARMLDARTQAGASTSSSHVEASPASKISSTYLSMEEDEVSPDQLACRDTLRAAKQLLREKNGPAAMVRFEKALMMSRALQDKIQERRANRGLAAAARLQGQYKTAITHLERVLEISKEIMDFSGYSDVYGAIADCYTDLDDFDKAAKYYDAYIAAMDSDAPPSAPKRLTHPKALV